MQDLLVTEIWQQRIRFQSVKLNLPSEIFKEELKGKKRWWLKKIRMLGKWWEKPLFSLEVNSKGWPHLLSKQSLYFLGHVFLLENSGLESATLAFSLKILSSSKISLLFWFLYFKLWELWVINGVCIYFTKDNSDSEHPQLVYVTQKCCAQSWWIYYTSKILSFL